ncbi:MAG: MFS transporter [Deltaproteobacteria bacterium]|nr:MFS transporter [Deltaproteobacteria bacterium]
MYKGKIFYGWWVVFACFVISLYVGGVVMFGFTAFFEPIIQEFGWSYTQVSFAASLRGLEMGIFAPLVGLYVDKLGPRKLFIAGVISAGLGLLILSSTQSLWTFYSAFLLLGLGAGGCLNVVTMSIIANWFRKNVGKAMGFMSSGIGAGGLFIPVIVFLIDSYGWRMALVILGAGMWIMGLPMLIIVRNTPEECGLYPDGNVTSSDGSDPVNEKQKSSLTFRDIIRKKSFLILNVIDFIRLVAATAVSVHIMPYMSNLGVSRMTAGFIAAAIPVTSIAGRVGLGWLGDFWDKRYVMILALSCMILGLLALAYPVNKWMIFLFLLFFPSGFASINVLRASYLRESYGKENFGKLLGITLGCGSMGGIIGPTSAGWVFDITGSYHFVWLGYIIILIMGIILILNMDKHSA